VASFDVIRPLGACHGMTTIGAPGFLGRDGVRHAPAARGGRRLLPRLQLLPRAADGARQVRLCVCRKDMTLLGVAERLGKLAKDPGPG
jgi:hypothetical protein